jgi:hypothetical protein
MVVGALRALPALCADGFAAPVILWGADASGDTLRQNARCSCCGNKGATIQHPGWSGNATGFLPFPSDCGLA